MGVKQWLFQRTSNFLFVLFGVWFFVSLLGGKFADFQTIVGLSESLAARIFLGLLLIIATLNAILAGWQIAGDYAHKINVGPNLIVAVVALISLGYLAVGFALLT